MDFRHWKRLEADKHMVRIVQGTVHFSAESPPVRPALTFPGMTSVHEPARLRRGYLVCSEKRARPAVVVVSAHGARVAESVW